MQVRMPLMHCLQDGLACMANGYESIQHYPLSIEHSYQVTVDC